MAHEVTRPSTYRQNQAVEGKRRRLLELGAQMDSPRIQRLQKLHELRLAGALTDQEFETQKQTLLDGSSRARRWPLLAGIGVAAAGLAVAMGVWSAREVAPKGSPTPKVRLATPAPTPSPSPSPSVDARSPAQRLVNAFEAATGHGSPFTRTINGEEVTTSPIRIVDLPFGPALLTRREIKDGCHACTGTIGVYYLRDDGKQITVTGSYPKAVEGWGWGAAPTEWELTTRFTSNPAIYASGGFTGQGITESSATITELRPTGPVTSDVIGTGFTNAGALTDDDPRDACNVDGKITNIVTDRSFEVAISGSVSGRDRYIKKAGRFVAAKKIDWGVPCPL